MDWLSLLSWQKGTENKGSERKRMLAGWFGGSRPWDQLCWALWLLHKVKLCRAAPEALRRICCSSPPGHTFTSTSLLTALLFESSAVQFSLLAKQKNKPFIFLSLSPTSPGRSTSSFRRRQTIEIARGRVLGCCWKSSFGWEWVLRQAQQLCRNLWLQPYNNFMDTCLVSASSHLCAAPPHLAIEQTGKPLSFLCEELNWLIKKSAKALQQQGNGWDREERRERG